MGGFDRVSGELNGKLENFDQISKQAKMIYSNKEYPTLKLEEIFAIKAYASNMFRPINHALRTGEGLSQYRHTIQAIQSGLVKLPPEKLSTLKNIPSGLQSILKYPAVLARGFKSKRHFFETWSPGQILKTDHLTSTSNNYNIASSWMFKETSGNSKVSEIMLLVSGKSGRRIPKNLTIVSEDEILFLPNSKFVFIDSQVKEGKNGSKIVIGFFREQ
jgi:hypothetical protein